MGRDPEAEYFQTVEEFFVSRRGDPLFLSNAEWLLIRKWRRAQVPLRVVLRGVADALDSHQHSFSRDQKVRSLSYCAAEVDRAAERWRRALASGSEEGPSPIGLEELEVALERARTPGPASRRVASQIAAEMRSRAGGSREELSAWLVGAEKKLVRALVRDQGEKMTARMEADVAAVLEPYRGRMPPKVLEQIREESRARRLLETHGLPRLSLFHSSTTEGSGAGAA